MKCTKWLFALSLLILLMPISAYAATPPKDFAEGVQRVNTESRRYLVQIFSLPNPDNPQAMSTGSGELIRSTGGVLRIITNAHVVGQAKKVMVYFEAGGYAQEVEVLGVDKAVDLALREAPRSLPSFVQPIAIAKTPVHVGDAVYADGYPFGNKNVTFGVITSLSSAYAQSGLDLFNSHQSPVSPGNSGGALVRFTDQGEQELVGINSQIVSKSGGSVYLSIRASVINRMLVRLEQERSVSHPYMGIVLGDPDRVNPYIIKSAGGAYPPAVQGIVVIRVAKNSLAARAGIKEGDIIRKFEAFLDGVWFELPVEKAEELVNAVFFDLTPDTRVRIQTTRGSQNIGRDFVLETQPEMKEKEDE